MSGRDAFSNLHYAVDCAMDRKPGRAAPLYCLVLNLQKIASGSAGNADLRCSFCGDQPPDDGALIAGSNVYICDQCVAKSSDLLADPRTTGSVDQLQESDDEEGLESVEPPASRRSVFFRLLSEADVTSLLTMDDLIDRMEKALLKFSAGEVVQPVRTVVAMTEKGPFFGLMPAYIHEIRALGAKLVTVFGQNAALDLPTHLATVLLFSPDTGALVAVMDGRYITEARTAAVSAVSANLLARDDASVMAILGSGRQARSHLEALDRVFELTDIRVWSPTPEHQAAFVEEMAPTTTARLVGSDSAEQAVSGADLIVLATSSPEPVIQSEWVKGGAHVMCVGACRHDWREMDPALTRRGRVFVDSRVSALAESGDIVLGIKDRLFTAAHIVGELGELLAGKVEGRRSPRDVTIFKSLGLAVEDVLAADLVYRRAVEREVGQELEL
jgi:alanine dehydrogenase